MGADVTRYSDKFPGDTGNYNWVVRFDVSKRGYLGITQFDGIEVKERVLLSPSQVKQLLKFLGK
jgi:hypothetical protein